MNIAAVHGLKVFDPLFNSVSNWYTHPIINNQGQSVPFTNSMAGSPSQYCLSKNNNDIPLLSANEKCTKMMMIVIST